MNRTPVTPPPSAFEARLATWLEEGPTSGPDELLSRTFARARSTRQDRVGLQRLTQPTRSNIMNSTLKFAAVGVFALAVGIGIGPLLSSSPDVASAPAASPSPSPTAVALGSHLDAGTYVATPFAGPGSSGVCEEPPQTGCTETTADDAITFTFEVPDGWSGLPPDGISSDAGTGLLFQRGADLFDDPCASDGTPQIAVGPAVADFTNALASHPLLDTTTPVDVELGGYSGRYLELQVPADLTGCTQFRPWYPWYYAQTPGERWHLWVIDVDGVRVVVQAIDHAETPPERQAELLAIVDSIEVKRPSNGWIAFSSQPHAGQVMPTDSRRGGDIYLAHDRDDLRVLVSRGPGMDTNVCPAFSPDGTRLAYGEGSDAGIAIVILDLAPDGSIAGTSRLPLDTTSTVAPCPRWSVDGTRIGSLEARNIVVVRGLDGSMVEARAGDPTYADFTVDYTRPLVSPSGDLSVRFIYGQEGVIVSPVDGSPDRTITGDLGGIVGWSPDSSQLLLMSDISGHSFDLRAVSVDEPYTVEVIADAIAVNGARSWPGRRDVSWQSLLE